MRNELPSALCGLGMPANSPNAVPSAFRDSVGQPGSRGLGCFAARFVHKGTPLVAEAALFSAIGPTKATAIALQANRLSAGQLAGYHSLSGPQTRPTCYRCRDFLGKPYWNYPVGGSANRQGIFLKASRFSHSCSPNVCCTVHISSSR